ncbi:MAG: HAD family hydrolase [Alphaproteobacteria bacterium]|nr:MAG: HAD family hydrolase [Alphaproteobacteria bacterium]
MGKVKAAIFDVDGTLVDSVDLHAAAWQRALEHFGHQVSFIDARGQIGKGGDKLIPLFLSDAEQADYGDAMEEYRTKLFRSEYLDLVRPFTAVPDLLRRMRDAGLKIAVASSAKQAELDIYLEVAGISDLIDANTCSDDVSGSKPDPDIFEAALEKLGCSAEEAMVIGDTPYDAIAAKRAGIASIGVLSGGFREEDLREAGCVAVYPGPAALFTRFANSPLAQ